MPDNSFHQPFSVTGEALMTASFYHCSLSLSLSLSLSCCSRQTSCQTTVSINPFQLQARHWWQLLFITFLSLSLSLSLSLCLSLSDGLQFQVVLHLHLPPPPPPHPPLLPPTPPSPRAYLPRVNWDNGKFIGLRRLQVTGRRKKTGSIVGVPDSGQTSECQQSQVWLQLFAHLSLRVAPSNSLLLHVFR